MLGWLIIVWAWVTLAVDRIVWRRIRRRPLRRAVAAALVVSDMLPILPWAVGKLMTDNTSGFFLFSMWCTWVFVTLALPRAFLYAAWLSNARPWVKVVAVFASVWTVALLVYGATFGRTDMKINRVEVCSPKLPEAFDGFRVVQFSDLHVATLHRPGREIRRMVDSILALDPDLVVFSGDLVNIRPSELDGEPERELRRLHAGAGVFSVLGNHDVGVYIKDTLALPPAEATAQLVRRQEAMGWRVVDDETIAIRRGDDSITLTGISFPAAQWEDRHKRDQSHIAVEAICADVPEGGFNITVSHLPQLWERIRAAGAGDLTLAGHVHSMQMRLNISDKCRLSPARLLYREWSGAYREGGSLLYINDGVGYIGLPLRLGAPAELTLFVLRRAEESR